jgi:hypothetical protein
VARGLLTAALPVGAALALNEAYFRADALIISLSRPYAELGSYALAWRASELVAVLPGVLLVSVFPLLSRYMATADARLRGALQTAFDVLCVVALGIAVGGAVLAGELARALGGDAFANAEGPLRVLLCAAALGCVNGLLGNALIARGLQVAALWLNAGALTANVALNVALVPSQGVMAAAWVAVACEAGLLGGTRGSCRAASASCPGRRASPARSGPRRSWPPPCGRCATRPSRSRCRSVPRSTSVWPSPRGRSMSGRCAPARSGSLAAVPAEPRVLVVSAEPAGSGWPARRSAPSSWRRRWRAAGAGSPSRLRATPGWAAWTGWTRGSRTTTGSSPAPRPPTSSWPRPSRHGC